MFDTIDGYYEFLETQTQLIKNNFIVSYISKMQDHTVDQDLKTKMDYEIYFENFILNQNNISLTDNAFNYLNKRAQSVQNTRLKAKYNHMLWSHNKNLTFAKFAIDNYLLTLQNSSFKVDDNLNNQAFAAHYKILLLLSQDVKYRKDEVLKYLISIFGIAKINGYQESALMKLVAKDGKSISREILETLYNYANTIIDNDIYPDFVKEYLELQIVLAQKIGQQIQDYQNKLGDYYINKGKISDGFIVHGYYLKALEQYKKSGNTIKFEEVSVLLQRAKSNLNFTKTEIEAKEVSELYEKMEIEIDYLISQLNASEIYNHLTLSTDIFPNAEQLDEEILPATFELVHVMVFDSNGNLNNKAKGGICPYAIYIQNFSLTFLQWIFYKGIKSKKLSFDSLYDHLLKNTWYGEDNSYINNERNSETFKWLDLLAPSLQNFFSQMESDIEMGIVNNIAYQLSIDSLAVKFEGLLRAFSDRLEAQTIDLKDSETQERISFEKFLDNPKFLNAIPQDDVALFKYLFTNKGMNFRNNVAHCFYKPKNYSVGMMWFLIVAILKLGNYDFKAVQN
ncbi:DUF4209 domain-containing protein [Flavobacterium tructae]|uniref:DUF4209 domain-containing protein n=1 Tax=Flavobacterium TaxID=237 RepID=UPI002223FED2|nr:MULTISPECIES: DUF4209 domain-containing protein [Flavobacterium]MDL2145113.1 DUF4209 domain-containing protein [Flavobacterium tructae]